MMTDRELLELAAKAAGIDAWWSEPFGFMLLRTDGNRKWSPLDNDGDALRLAVKLRLMVGHSQARAIAKLGTGFDDPGFAEAHGDDPTAATRRAIVLAAAEIGKQLKEQP